MEARDRRPARDFAVGSLPILLLELNRAEQTGGDRLLIDIVNVTVLVVFALDYIVELCLAADRRAYVWHRTIGVGARRWPMGCVISTPGSHPPAEE